MSNEAETLQHHRWANSTMVREAWYDPSRRRLEVRFVDGVRWIYTGISKLIWQGFRTAPSAGGYVNGVLNNYNNHAKGGT